MPTVLRPRNPGLRESSVCRGKSCHRPREGSEAYPSGEKGCGERSIGLLRRSGEGKENKAATRQMARGQRARPGALAHRHHHHPPPAPRPASLPGKLQVSDLEKLDGESGAGLLVQSRVFLSHARRDEDRGSLNISHLLTLWKLGKFPS